MIEYKEVPKRELMVVKKTCDSCGMEVTNEKIYKNEWDNFHHIRFITSKGSLFGVGVDVKIDLCQRCVYEMIKKIWEKRQKTPNQIKK